MKFIGIDPDIKENGVAFADNNEFELRCLDFHTLIDYIKLKAPDIVIIEGGWLNKGNWHLGGNHTKRSAAATGYRVGENHRVGKLLVEYCERNSINHLVVKPQRSKLDHKQFTSYFEKDKAPSRSNPEKRDAAMLIFRHPDYIANRYGKGVMV